MLADEGQGEGDEVAEESDDCRQQQAVDELSAEGAVAQGALEPEGGEVAAVGEGSPDRREQRVDQQRGENHQQARQQRILAGRGGMFAAQGGGWCVLEGHGGILSHGTRSDML